MSSLLLLLLMAICAATTTKNNNRKEETPKTMQAPPLCYGGGIPGMHGKPGSAGAPGRDGRDGRDGAKGDQGLPGKIGSQGPPGAVGPAGEKGHHGARGEPGVQGPPGQIGDGGPLPFKNWKECAWKNLDIETEKGLIKDCVFTKNHTDTALHVYWSGAFRLAGCNNCCRRWYFTFNGAECSAPLPIDGIVYLDTSSNHNPHRVRHVEGHCNGIHKGKVRVGFWVGTCERYSQAGSAYTGYRSVSRIFIEEVPKAQA